MSEFPFFIELVKYVGFPALIFIVFFIYHKSQTKILMQVIKNMEERERALNEYMQQQIETLQCLVGAIARIEYKIDMGMQCPIKKEMMK
jgi:hypothetical protein